MILLYCMAEIIAAHKVAIFLLE